MFKAWPLLMAALTAAACGGGTTHAAPPSAMVPSSTSATQAPETTSTTVWAVSAPQASPDAAAADLVSAWARGDRTGALTVASPAVAAVLFGTPYPSGYLQPRGCQEGVSPGTCTYRDTRTDAIYEIQVSSTPSGWYVSAINVES